MLALSFPTLAATMALLWFGGLCGNLLWAWLAQRRSAIALDRSFFQAVVLGSLFLALWLRTP